MTLGVGEDVMTTVFQFYILLEFSLCQGSRDILVCKSTRNGGRVLRMFTSSELFFSFAFFSPSFSGDIYFFSLVPLSLVMFI